MVGPTRGWLLCISGKCPKLQAFFVFARILNDVIGSLARIRFATG